MDLAHERGLKALVALRGSSAIYLAREYKPGAITLDINLPDVAGWTILDRLKHDPATRHIPVHIISGDENRRRGLALGAMTYLEKAVVDDSLAEAFNTIQRSAQQRLKKVLIGCADEEQRDAITDILAAPDIDISYAQAAGEVLAALNRQYLDGIVLHGSLEGLPLLELVEEIQAAGSPYVPPVLLITMHPITTEEEMDLARLNRTSMVKPVNSLDRLLEESVLLLHRAEFVLRPEQTRKLEMLRMNDPALTGKHVLVVDDEVRNIFALTSLLEDHNLVGVHAENGRAGIELLESSPHIDIVLMDIMMPGMDGYE